MEIFDSAVRSKGDLAGVFEYEEQDGPQSATAYFYLYEPDGSIIGAIHVRSGAWSITEADIAIKWDKDEQRVGLFVFGVLTAAFDAETGARYGGRHGKDFNAEIPWSQSMPVKQLLILRHAKSSWGDTALADFDRPLAPRGLKTAPLMGRELARRGWLPDLALVSPALRARDTWRLVAQELSGHTPAQFAGELYEAAAGAILARVRQAKATSLLVIGHNPGLQHFVLRLAGAGSDESAFKKIEAKFPTAALARFTLDGDWANLDFGGARLTHCLRPKDLG